MPPHSCLFRPHDSSAQQSLVNVHAMQATSFQPSQVHPTLEKDNEVVSFLPLDSINESSSLHSTSDDEIRMELPPSSSSVDLSIQDDTDCSMADFVCGIRDSMGTDPNFMNAALRMELAEEFDSASSISGDDEEDASVLVCDVATTNFSHDAPSPFSNYSYLFDANESMKVNASKLQPADEALLTLCIENNLPQEMYTKILDWAAFAQCSEYKIDKAPVFVTALHRLHAKYANICGGPPISEVVMVPGYQPMHVYRFDFLEQAKRLLADEDLMHNSLWDYDAKLNDKGDRVYSEMNTGDFWKLGCAYVRMRASLPTADKSHRHVFIPVILFIDATLADNLGRLTAEPVLCSIGNICGVKRRDPSSWFILGFIPPYPKSQMEASADRCKADTKYLQAKYYHDCLRSILQDLLAADNNVDGHLMSVASSSIKSVRAHFKLSLVIGDTEGHDKVTTHFKSYSSNIERVSRDCNLKQDRCDDVDASCQFVNIEEIRVKVMQAMDLLNSPNRRGSKKQAHDLLKSISQLPVLSAFYDFDFCGDRHGIFGSCPFERLHAWLLGIMKDGMRYLFNLCDLPKDFIAWCNNQERKASNRPELKVTEKHYYISKAKFEAIFRFLTMCSRRQSDREVPRTPFKNGVTDLKRLNGQEYPGLVMLTLVTLKGLLSNNDVSKKIQKQIVTVFWQMLSLNEQLASDCLSSTELKELDERLKVFLTNYKELFGHIALSMSSVGLRKVKFHAPKHFSFYIKRYGCSENFFGGSLESALKSTIKAPSKRTSRRHDHLCKELAMRQHDRFCISASKKHNGSWEKFVNESTTSARKRKRDVCDATDLQDKWTLFHPAFSLSKQDGHWSTHLGKHTFNNQVLYPDIVSGNPSNNPFIAEKKWVDKVVQVADEQHFSRIEVSCGASFLNDLLDEVSGQSKTSLIRCHPSFHSYPYLRRPWHDWVMVEWVEEDESGSEHIRHVAARLLMFAKLSLNLVDGFAPPKVVAVIQSLRDYEPDPDSLLTFAAGDEILPDIEVVDADTIYSTAFVLPCNKHPNDPFPLDINDATYFIVMPPRTEWKNIGWE